MALDLKKRLVDADKLEISQDDLERALFDVMTLNGYGASNIALYRMMSQFHHQRTPLVILVGGSMCVGKSTLATALAERMNLPSVLNTDFVSTLLSDGAMIDFDQECAQVQMGTLIDFN